MLFKVNSLGVNWAKRTQPPLSVSGVHLGQREEGRQAVLHGWVEIVSREQMRWDIDILRPPVNICCGQRLRHCKQAGGVPVSRPIPQNTPQAAGMVQGKQGRKVVGTGHAPAGPVVFHPVPNNREDVALHAPAPGGLLALVGQWRVFFFSLV